MGEDKKKVRKWDEPHGAEYALDEPEFMAEYGRAMADWGSLEHQLGHVFGLSLRTKPEIAGAVFFAVPGFRDKVSMVNAVIAARFVDEAEVQSDWRAISEQCLKISKSRNRIAHMHVWQGPNSGTWGAQDLWQMSQLPIKWNERKQYVVTVEELRRIRSRFNAVTTKLLSFSEVIEKKPVAISNSR